MHVTLFAVNLRSVVLNLNEYTMIRRLWLKVDSFAVVFAYFEKNYMFVSSTSTEYDMCVIHLRG